MRILINMAQCKKCKDVIISEHENDIINCKCGNLSIWGGKKCTRREWKSKDDDKSAFKEMSLAAGDNITEEAAKAAEKLIYEKIMSLLDTSGVRLDKNKGIMNAKGKGSVLITQTREEKNNDK